jgi:hypothetical protein
MLRIFVSSTSLDLHHHRKVVESAILDQQWHPVVMEHFGTSTEPTLEACTRAVERCDLLILMVAFRRGRVPTVAQGGDGLRSVTAFELDVARRRGIPVRVLMARESWPGSLWEDDQDARIWVRRFREELNQLAEFFDVETLTEGSTEPRPGREFRSLVRKVLLDHRDWLREQSAAVPTALGQSSRLVGAETMLPALEPLLGGLLVGREELVKIYQRSAPAGWPPPSAERNPLGLLADCARSLAQAPRQAADGMFPLLRFVQLLASTVGGEAGAALEAWVAESSTRLGIEQFLEKAAVVDAKWPAVPESPAATSHLLVQVSPRLCEPGRYGVKAWLMGGGEPACLTDADEAMGREGLPARLDQLREELLCRGLEPEHAWIELLLPRELLCADVDQWDAQLDFIDSVPIGAEHRLVVRSLERASRRKAVLALQSRSRAMRRLLACRCQLVDAPSGEEGTTLWIEKHDCGGAVLYSTLKDAQMIISAGLGQPPPAEPRDPTSDVLNTLFAAGLPVVLWLRPGAGGKPLAARDELAELIGQEPLARLPDRVWELRRQAVRSTDANHAGRRLTLLWDDPERRSPDFEDSNRLRAPAGDV